MRKCLKFEKSKNKISSREAVTDDLHKHHAHAMHHYTYIASIPFFSILFSFTSSSELLSFFNIIQTNEVEATVYIMTDSGIYLSGLLIKVE